MKCPNCKSDTKRLTHKKVCAKCHDKKRYKY